MLRAVCLATSRLIYLWALAPRPPRFARDNDQGFAFASLLIDNDWVPGANPAAATPRPTIKPTAKPTFKPTPSPKLQTCQSLCHAWAAAAYSVTDTSPWCGTCTQSGINCFTGSNSCQGPYSSDFCRVNMAGTVCARD